VSRVGKNPVIIPEGVICSISSEGVLKVKGKLGSLILDIPFGISVNIDDSKVFVKPSVDTKKVTMLWGTIRSLICNIVKGVHIGFVKSLEINGVGYRSHIKSNCLILNLGYSHEISYAIPDGIKRVCKKPTLIDVSGINRQLVGQVASKIRSFRKPEPYKGKGIKYVDEVIFRKEGKKK
jgi:large subunit ribosomal protein L6